MTSQYEKIRKLRALGRSPNKHEAAAALAKAKELEDKAAKFNAKDVAYAIGQLLEARGMRVQVRRRKTAEDLWSKPKFEAEVRSAARPGPQSAESADSQSWLQNTSLSRDRSARRLMRPDAAITTPRPT
jgi:hypothetical protein